MVNPTILSTNAYHPAIRFKTAADGNPGEQQEEPIAADAKPQRDSKEQTKLKVVARLLGVRLDKLLRRAEQSCSARCGRQKAVMPCS